MNRARSQGLVWPYGKGVNRVARLSRIVGALANLGHRLSNQTGQRPPSPWYFSGAEAKAIGLMEELYPLIPGVSGGNGLLHDGSPNAQNR